MSPVISNLLLKSTAETFYMLGVSALIAAVVGIPLGILLVVTEKNGILACRLLNKPLAFVINMIRSIPFIILMVAIIPLTRLTPLFGTCALQLVDGPLEVLQILEILVDAGEAHVRHHVQVTQRLENRLADLIRFDLGQSS